MSCNLYQDRILEYEQLTAGEQQSVDAHIQVCPQCREVAREWRALDSALSQQLRSPGLSAVFDAQLHQRIARETAARTEAGLAERRRALEAEYAASRQRQNARRWIPQSLDVLSFGVAGGIAGWILVILMSQAGAAWSAASAFTSTQMFAVSSAAGILIALGLAASAFSGPLRRAVLR